MENESSRNTIIFIVCALVILLVYNTFVLDPAAKRREAEARMAQAAQAQQLATTPGGVAPGAFVPVNVAVAGSPRVKLDSPGLSGTIALRGARIDDLYLKHYQQTTDPKSPPVEMFRPQGAEHAWYAQVGWTGAGVAGLPDANTIWTAAPGAVLTPATPLVLTYDNGQGLKFDRTLSVDKDYMFQISDTVTNTGPRPVTLASYGSVEQRGLPADPANSGIVHEGAIGELQSEGGASAYNLKLKKYKDWKKDGLADQTSTGGWLGITQKYWLAALIPDQSSAIRAQFHVVPVDGVDVYQAGYIGPAQTIAPGASISKTTHLFAGAKTVPLLRQYQTTLGAPQFDNAVDWGNLWFLTRPMFGLLEFFYHHVGSIGLAILALTVAVKALFFPLANKSYESMSKMKKIQPKVEEIKKKYEKDPAKLQQETMALYQQEKINPLMGCLPMLVQIPVFYSLYKILTVTIEMRHAPFYGWVHDLSARDPTSVWTLFGLIPWHPGLVPLIGSYLDGPLHIGLWPLIYGFSMWLSQSMNPPAADPTQQKIFQFMPLIFTFTMSQFTVGLVIYWSWQNTLSILQQYVIMHRLKVDNPIDTLIQRFAAKPKAVG
jgi:YidC/Oxa1 family membrane protein insertase